MGWTLQTGEALRRDALDEFTRNTGIQVDLIPTPGNSAEQFALIRRLLSRHAPVPDVYLIDIIWPSALAEHLLDLRPYFNPKSSNHVPELLKNDTIDGRLVSLPFYVNVGMLYYRRDLLEKYGFRRPPASWDEMEAMAARIQKAERSRGNRNFWGYVWQGAAYEGLTCNALEWQVSSGGGRIIEPDGSVTVNNPLAAQAFRRAAGWVGSISPPSVLSYTETDSLNVFRSGNAAFLRYWTTRSATDSKTALSILPAGSHGRAHTVGGFHLGVSRYSKYPDEAAGLVTYLSDMAVQLRRGLREGYLPTLSCLYRNPELRAKLPHLDLIRALPRDAFLARPSSVTGSNYADVSRAYYQAVHSILSRASKPADALNRLEKQLRQVISPDVKGRP
jgi:trehalose/maltose transport system substrate-binding protein